MALDFLRQRRWPLGVAVVVLVLYGVLGHWVAPGIGREQIVQQLSAVLDRPVRLGALRINPYALSATAEDFVIEERDGAPIAAFDELYVNFSATSALRLAWTFSEIRLTRPQVALVIRSDGTFNLAALGGPRGSEAVDEPAGGVLRVAAGQLIVMDGRLGFEDRRGQRPCSGEVSRRRAASGTLALHRIAGGDSI